MSVFNIIALVCSILNLVSIAKGVYENHNKYLTVFVAVVSVIAIIGVIVNPLSASPFLGSISYTK